MFSDLKQKDKNNSINSWIKKFVNKIATVIDYKEYKYNIKDNLINFLFRYKNFTIKVETLINSNKVNTKIINKDINESITDSQKYTLKIHLNKNNLVVNETDLSQYELLNYLFLYFNRDLEIYITDIKYKIQNKNQILKSFRYESFLSNIEVSNLIKLRENNEDLNIDLISIDRYPKSIDKYSK